MRMQWPRASTTFDRQSTAAAWPLSVVNEPVVGTCRSSQTMAAIRLADRTLAAQDDRMWVERWALLLAGALLAACGGELEVDTPLDASTEDATSPNQDGGDPDGATPQDSAQEPIDGSGMAGADAGHGDATSGMDGGTPMNTSRACTVADSETEFYSLGAPPSPPSDVTFLTDWERLTRGGGFLGYQTMSACQLAYDPSFRTWHGLAAVRVEVNANDDPIGSGERSEVIYMQSPDGTPIEESRASGRQFFGISYYFPASWEATYLRGNPESWSGILQFHPGSGDGYFMLLMAGVREPADGQRFFYAGGEMETFTDGSQIRLGEWVDLVLDFDFSTGQARIYRRNEGESQFRLVLDIGDSTMVSDSASHMKQGLYRGSDVDGRTDVLWMGPTSRGNTFAAVEMASFGTANGF